MSFWIYVDDVSEVADWIWEAKLGPEDVKHIGKEISSLGEVSVIGVTGEIRFVPNAQLAFNPRHAVVLNQGQSDRCLFVHITSTNMAGAPEVETGTSSVFAQTSPSGFGRGDAAFIAACREHVSSELVGLAKGLLSAVRQRYPGQMREGKARKWVNYPENFFAVTIQNRIQSYRVSVKGKPQVYRGSTLDIGPGRKGYSDFKLSESIQLQEAIRIVLQSATRSTA